MHIEYTHLRVNKGLQYSHGSTQSEGRYFLYRKVQECYAPGVSGMSEGTRWEHILPLLPIVPP